MWMPRDEFLHMWIAQQAAWIYLYTYKTCRQSIQVCSCLMSPAPCPQTHTFLWAVSESPMTPLREVTEQPQPSLEDHLVPHGRTQHIPCPWPPCPARSSLWHLGMSTWWKLTMGWAKKKKGAFFHCTWRKQFNGKRMSYGNRGKSEGRQGSASHSLQNAAGGGLLCLKTGLAGISRGGSWGKYLVGKITCFKCALKFQEPFSYASEIFPAWQSHRESR